LLKNSFSSDATGKCGRKQDNLELSGSFCKSNILNTLIKTQEEVRVPTVTYIKAYDDIRELYAKKNYQK
jgi:hypothetical protein